MRRRPRVLVDVDGPLTSCFVRLACARLRSLGVGGAWPEALKEYDVLSLAETSLLKEELLRTMRAPGVALGFGPNPGAREFLDELRGWADVVAVTSPLDGSQTWAWDREVWLERVLGFDLRDVVSARSKAPIAGDALVDDKFQHLSEWSVEQVGMAILWETPHNVANTWLLRASDYDQLKSLLEELRR